MPMGKQSGRGELFPSEAVAEGLVIVNQRCQVRTQDAHRLVLVSGVPLAHYAVGDRMAEAHAMVSLVEQGFAEQVEVATAFECTTRTVRRYQERFTQGGLAALGRGSGYPKGRPRVRFSRVRLVNRLKSEGLSNRVIAQRIGVTEKAVRKLLRRSGWREGKSVQRCLPWDSAEGSGDDESERANADPNLSTMAEAAPVETGVEEAAAPAEPAGREDSNLSAPTECSLAAAEEAESERAEEEPLPVSFDTDPDDRRVDRLLA